MSLIASFSAAWFINAFKNCVVKSSHATRDHFIVSHWTLLLERCVAHPRVFCVKHRQNEMCCCVIFFVRLFLVIGFWVVGASMAIDFALANIGVTLFEGLSFFGLLALAVGH